MKKLATLGILLLLICVSVSLVHAQSEQAVRINLIHTLETPDEMRLKLYFSLYDPNTQKPITALEAEEAHITLLNSNYVAPAVIQPPDIPIYVTLLLDASGSMLGSDQQLRNAAKLALNSPPDNALFGVVQFGEEIKLLQDFSDNIPAVQFAIDQYAVTDQGTCLYDAAYAAVEAQASAPPGRRAVILFTDGKDEKIGGMPCSTHALQDLIELALEMQVSIHTVGLSGQNSNINEVELKNIATITGGFSFIANQVDLVGAFTQIMESLKAQWMVEAEVYPAQGENEGVFSLVFEEGQTLNTAFAFESKTDYPGPPSPVQVRLDGLQLMAETQSYELQLTVSSPELVGYVKVALWDEDAGSKVADYIFDNPAFFNSFDIPTDQMAADRQYQLRISAINAENDIPFMIVENSRGEKSSELLHDFRFDPSSIFASGEITSVTQTGGDLVLNVSFTNPAMIGGLDGWLVNKETNTRVENSEFNLPASAASEGQIEILMRENRISSGVYTVVLRVLNSNQQVLMTTQYEDVTYRAPNIIQRIVLALFAEPIFLIAIIGIILGVVFFLLVISSRQKSLTGTPVMQGQLGKSKKAKNKQQISAIAEDEPLGSMPQSRDASHSAVQTPPPPRSLSINETVKADETVLYSKAKPDTEPVLEIIKGPGAGTRSLKKFPFVIGRVDCDLTLDEPSVSRKHAEINRDAQNNYYLTDLNSSNGTRLNGQLLEAGQKEALFDGARINLGANVSLLFELK